MSTSPTARSPTVEIRTARHLWRYVGGLAALAALVAAAAVVAGPGRPSPAPALWFLVVLWLLTVLADAKGIEIPLPVGNEHVSFIEIVLVPAMVLLPPAYAIGVALTAGVTLDTVIERKLPIKAVFNTSSRVLGVTLGAVTYHALVARPFAASLAHVLAAGAAGTVLVLVTAAAFGGLRTILVAGSWRTTVRELAPRSLFDLGLAATGVLAAVLTVAAPVALPLLLVPTSVDLLRMRVRAQTYELQASKERAEAANLAKTEFLSGVSHELRTPLSVILGYGQLLEVDDELPDEARESVAAIVRSGRHLLGLIDEILDISRIESGQLDVVSASIPLGPVLEESVGLVRPLATARTVRLTVDAGTEDLWVSADRQRLVQVLLNLLSNAITYDREGGHVAVTAHRSGDWVEIAVSDTGPGIADDEMDRLFVPFERLASAAGTTGTGLGLSIVVRLVEAMGGTVAVTSHVGEGSTFTVALRSGEHG